MVDSAAQGTDVPIVSHAELERDPHGVFKRFRRHAPTIMLPDGARIVLRASDVRRLGSDPRLASAESISVEAGSVVSFSRTTMLFSNGADHARRRAPFTKLFSVGMIGRLRSEIRAVAHALIDGWRGLDRTELVDSFTGRLPLLAVGKLIGLPEADVPRVLGLVCSVARTLSDTAFRMEDVPQIEHDLRLLLGGTRRLIEDRQRRPRGDFLSSYLASDLGGSLSSSEAVAQIALLFVGATDTTRVSMASMIVLLLEHRDQWDAVASDPSCHRQAAVEALRFEPGVASFHRVSREPVAIDGDVIPAQTSVHLSALSAQRDETVFSEPDRFDIFRDDLPKSVIAFGAGPHRCLGEALSILVLEEGVGALATRLPGLRLAGPTPITRGSTGVRRISPVHVTWS